MAPLRFARGDGEWSVIFGERYNDRAVLSRERAIAEAISQAAKLKASHSKSLGKPRRGEIFIARMKQSQAIKPRRGDILWNGGGFDNNEAIATMPGSGQNDERSDPSLRSGQASQAMP